MKNRPLIFLVLMICRTAAFGQANDYRYSRQLEGTTDTWNRIIIPSEVFGKVKSDLSDIRIFGITAGNDTIEAPYLLVVDEGETESRTVAFTMLNRVRNQNGYYYTLKLEPESTINNITMDFGQENFDWKVNLEGSRDMNEWFSIAEDYRILSINNQHTEYQFTRITFPDARFPYFRISIPASQDPEVEEVKVTENVITAGKFTAAEIKHLTIENDRELHQTVIRIDMDQVSPVSFVRIRVRDGFDYYRPVGISSITDSLETPKGRQYSYRHLGSGTLSSLEKPEFSFPGVFAKRLHITIDNHNNPPLQVDSVTVKGHVHELIFRITEPAGYFLAYGDVNAYKPVYDIGNFRDRFPENIALVSLGEERVLIESLAKPHSILDNKILLWGVMIVIILVLGWFSIRMISKKA